MNSSAILNSGAKESRATGRGPQLIDDLFHALNQPITALQCSLELSLRRPLSALQYRDALEAALQQAELIAQQVVGIRELLQAEDPGDNQQVLALGSFLCQLVSDLQPLAESAGVQLLLRGAAPCHVLLEPRRLQQALFYLVEFALCSSAAGSTVKLDLSEREKDAVIGMYASPPRASGEASCGNENWRERARQLAQQLGLAICRRIVETAGGSLQVAQAPDCLQVELRLPLERSFR